MLVIRLDKKTEERLAKLALRTGRTKTYHAREAILEHLEDLEDMHLAFDRLAHPERIYSAEEVKRTLGL